MEQSLTIVIGTTPDYVIRIQGEERTRGLLFVLDYKYVHDPELTETENSHLLFSDTGNYEKTLSDLKEFLSEMNDKDPRFVCFDCEALLLTGRLAEHFNSPFPSPDSILKSRNKFLSGRIWLKNGIATPECGLASGLPDSLRLFYEYGRDVVLKPVSGSGSELLFHCNKKEDIVKAVLTLEEQLEKRRDNPLFAPIQDPLSGDIVDPCMLWIVEEFIDGPEYSIDFFMNNNRVTILRETGKIKDYDYPFGTISGYTIPPSCAALIKRDEIEKSMLAAARSLGFERGYFMADYIIGNNRINMIELTPRPGGDSLPDLIKASSGGDILKTYMDIMCGDTSALKNFTVPSEYYTSIHFYPDRGGIISEIDTSDIVNDPRFRFLELKKKKGDMVTLPPDDYDNRLLGYCVISSRTDISSLATCKDIQQKLKITFIDSNRP